MIRPKTSELYVQAVMYSIYGDQISSRVSFYLFHFLSVRRDWLQMVIIRRYSNGSSTRNLE